MQDAVTNLLEIYLEEGSPESFLRLRAAVAALPDYAPYTNTPEKVLATVEEGNHEQAIAALHPLVWGWFLSPRLHTFLAFFHHKLGDGTNADVEFELRSRCLQGILLTGTGEEARPYLVLHTADEHDLLEHLGTTSLERRFVTTKQRQAYDVHKCGDGVTRWFDVTTPYSRLVASQNGQA